MKEEEERGRERRRRRKIYEMRGSERIREKDSVR